MRRAMAVVLASAAFATFVSARAEDASSRPTIGFYRWQEDWSVLADPAYRTEAFDSLKYISLSDEDSKRYLSFGITLRERYEYNDAPGFGVAGLTERDYLIHRLELHADAHVTDRTRVFVQVENALAPGLSTPGPVDANKLDLRLAFLDSSIDLGDGVLKYRVGRQEMAFDLQRFISVRDGPNVRQAYDALWTGYEWENWRVTGFMSQPVQYRNGTTFDDFSDRHLTYGGTRVQRNAGGSELSATFSEYRNDHAQLPGTAGEEHRDNIDVRDVGKSRGFDWDIEGMSQRGSFAGKSVDAWAVGTLGGYTFAQTTWKPRIGVQLDAASGDRDLVDGRVETFNPMFPNGYYVTLSGYTGYTNFIHLKTSLTVAPKTGMKVLLAVGQLWRETTHDAVYMQPNIPVPRTAGQPGRRSATYFETRVDWTLTRAWSVALEADHYDVGDVIRRAGGHDSNYLGLEAKWGW